MATLRLGRRRSDSIGIAIGRNELHFFFQNESTCESYVMQSWTADSAFSQCLDQKLEALQAERSLVAARVSIALLPDLFTIAEIDTPRLRQSDLQRLLRSNSVRYFNSSAQLEFCCIPLPGGRRIAMGIDSGLLDTIEAAIERRHWKLQALIPSYAAWLRGAPTLRGYGQTGAGVEVVIVGREVVHRLTVTKGIITAIRRAPKRLSSVRVKSFEPDSPDNDSVVIGALGTEAAEVTAARYAPRVTAPRWHPRKARQRLQTRQRKVQFVVGVLAAAGFGFGVGADAQLRENELSDIRIRRAVISHSVKEAQHAEQAASDLENSLTALAEVEARTPLVTSLVADLSANLPPLAFVSSFKMRSDTVALQVVSYSSRAVMAGLSKSNHLKRPQLRAPVQRQSDSISGTRELLLISATTNSRMPNRNKKTNGNDDRKR